MLWQHPASMTSTTQTTTTTNNANDQPGKLGISIDDLLGLQAACFEWADSYDAKDWERLSRCIAPTLRIDYRSFLNKLWPAMPAAEFIAMASSPTVLGDPLLRTQHFIGGTRWERVSATEAIGYHQLRVPHQKYTDATLKTVAVKGHAHSHNTHWYRKVEGEWKFAGLNPEIRWFEYDFDRVFEGGREAFGEEGEKKGEMERELVGRVSGVPVGIGGEKGEEDALDVLLAEVKGIGGGGGEEGVKRKAVSEGKDGGAAVEVKALGQGVYAS
ncbi:hypothetical protein EJ05DRAFT_364425 [Pseudovirgaria hyperparasitica]|uniref:Scytalone dehydratase-like domain-containing protein n=1 Tax=Pseudovirgaria hyperparasitica TaxID=470096 RepID=A0A6A6WB24_9PEZI|nr:uncharacterized protein EJ05DRAFT_364425 [Pseudovirgaria hyperparasitica]KAF2758797.1 hypothetical protein EJ05DRAFT_364425 [Pseudovirgaria hyperparasitica]